MEIFKIFCINKTEVGVLLTAEVWKYLLPLPIPFCILLELHTMGAFKNTIKL